MFVRPDESGNRCFNSGNSSIARIICKRKVQGCRGSGAGAGRNVGCRNVRSGRRPRRPCRAGRDRKTACGDAGRYRIVASRGYFAGITTHGHSRGGRHPWLTPTDTLRNGFLETDLTRSIMCVHLKWQSRRSWSCKPLQHTSATRPVHSGFSVIPPVCRPAIRARLIGGRRRVCRKRDVCKPCGPKGRRAFLLMACVSATCRAESRGPAAVRPCVTGEWCFGSQSRSGASRRTGAAGPRHLMEFKPFFNGGVSW